MEKDEYKIRIGTKKEWDLEEQIAQEFGKPKLDSATKSATESNEVETQSDKSKTHPDGP